VKKKKEWKRKRGKSGLGEKVDVRGGCICGGGEVKRKGGGKKRKEKRKKKNNNNIIIKTKSKNQNYVPNTNFFFFLNCDFSCETKTMYQTEFFLQS
jgi:hypothetical protein